ncbi:DUF6350 family protein [Salinibacterium sp. GXW1014]|uniref:cell division protein PerM n=1 Tax=Salinibacterium sp. GXW1014 TaxID=3377838 RepID=UPI00383BA56A
MNRSLTAVFSGLEALLVVGIGIAIPLLPLTFMWGFQYELQVEWPVFWRAAVDTWLLGHGASMRATVDPDFAATLGLPALSEPFILSLAPLGFALLTLLLGQRAGRRIAETPHHLLGLGVAAATFAVLAFAAVMTSLHELARPSIVQGTIFTTLVFVAGLAIGAGLARYRLSDSRPKDLVDRAVTWLTDWPAGVQTVVWGGLRAGVASVAAVMLVASVVVAVLVAVNYGGIIALYEASQGGPLGVTVLTVAQLAFVPNLVIWAASWLLGPGFAIGAGSAVSPLGTTLGPIPPIPVLGAVPTGDLAWGFLGILVPVIAGFLVGAFVRMRSERMLELPSTVALGSLAGVVAGAVFALLAWWSGGSGGPGRLELIGPNPLLVGLCAALEVGVACILGLLVAGRRLARSE